MKIQNIDRVLIFREDADGHVLTLEELESRYSFAPDGTIFYYGVNAENVANFGTTKVALNPSHQAFFDAMLASLGASSDDEKTVVLGVEPPSDKRTPYQYGFVASHLDLVRQLATELAEVQQRARDLGKRLNLSVRYASEMNDKHSDQAQFKSTFIQVRTAFQELAPAVLFSFSPALRADLSESLITDYWPGSQYVDLIGGTWYIHGDDERAASTANMRAYFLHRATAGKPFALSEFGGADATWQHNDDMLQFMVHELEALQLQGVSFKYGTIFVTSGYGTDAKLAFLKQPSVATVRSGTAIGVN